MTTDTFVKYFSSDMSGAPSLSETAGTLISVLDACLVNGFGSVTLNSLVVASNVATATVSTGHNFPLVGATGMVIRIEGATPSGLNGDWRIQSATTTQFTFTTAGIADQTATGTITAKRAPAGFSKAFSGTNKAAYRNNATIGTGFYLRVDDTVSQVNPTTMYETMSDVDTGTNAAATWFTKAYTGYAGKWWLVADSRTLYLFSNWDDATGYSGLAFGDLITPGIDLYACVIIGNELSAYATARLAHLSSSSGGWIARDSSGVGSAVAAYRRSHSVSGGYTGNTGATYPNAIGDKLVVAPIDVWKSDSTVLRGELPGIFNPLHAGSGLTQETIINADGHDLLIQKVISAASGSCVALDITGPWR